MSSEWKTLTLNDVCLKITDGAHQSPRSVAIGKSMASVKDLTRFGVDLTSARKISISDFDNLVKQGCQPIVGDVLIAKDGNSALDTVCSVDSPLDAVLLSSVAILRPNQKIINSHYLKHYLSSKNVIDYLKSNFISGAAIPRVVLRDFKKAEIQLPSLSEQQHIASFLEVIDGRINLLRKTNATLEAMAQALFKSWFVDFAPVHAKQQGRAPEGMDAATAALFPDSFEESELGMVPKGWKVGTLQDLLVLQRGFDLPASQREEGEYPIIAASGKNGTHRVAQVKGPGVITGRSGVLGKVFLELNDFWPLNTTLWVKEFKAATPCYSFELLKLLDFSAFNAGSAVPTLNRNHIHGLQYLIPDSKAVQAYEVSAMSLHQRVLCNENQAKSLEQLRDTLLPRLISGQLRLPEAQELAQAAVAE